MSFSSETEHRSRKMRRCESCGGEISIGDRYRRWAGMVDGTVYAIDYHPECRAAEVDLNGLLDTEVEEWLGLREALVELKADTGTDWTLSLPSIVQERLAARRVAA